MRAQRIELPRRVRRTATTRPPPPTTASRHAQHAARNLALPRARIARVDLAIDDAIEAHRREARAGEREHDPADIAPASPARRYDASTTPTSANGSANTVCGSFTKFAYDDEPRAALRERLPFARATRRRRRRHRSTPPESRATATSRPRALRRVVHLDHAGPLARESFLRAASASRRGPSSSRR